MKVDGVNVELFFVSDVLKRKNFTTTTRVQTTGYASAHNRHKSTHTGPKAEPWQYTADRSVDVYRTRA